MLRFDRAVRSVARMQAGVAGLAALLAAAGCGAPADTGFSMERGAKHVRMLATAFGSRPTGSEANGRARDYIVAELRQAGFEVRLQEALATTGSGLSTPVVNIIAIRPGRQAESVALVSHYDSPPESRGAADAGLGVAVCVEAGRVLAARSDARYTLLVALTDGEELGLMGARALRNAPEFARVRAFLNVEAVGTSGPPRLFQAGPGNSWLTAAWAASAPRPSGSSLFTEIYRRLPNDTDFSVLAPAGPPGLNFAPTGNTFAYHTRLDTPARLESDTLQQMGDTAISVVRKLDGVDISQRSTGDGTYFDLVGWAALAYSGGTTRVIAAIVFVLGLLAAFKAFLGARAEVGTVRLLVTSAWTLLGTGVLFGALYAACALLQAGTALHQPWYAQAHVFLTFLASVAFGAVWLVGLLGRALPVMVAPSGHPSCVWALALPVWAGLLAFLQLMAPGAGYLFALPLLAAAVGVLAMPIRSLAAGRWVSLAAAGVSTVLWAPLVWPLLEFLVGLSGSLPTPVPGWLFPAFFVVAVSTMGPSLAGLTLGPRAADHPGKRGRLAPGPGRRGLGVGGCGGACLHRRAPRAPEAPLRAGHAAAEGALGGGHPRADPAPGRYRIRRRRAAGRPTIRLRRCRCGSRGCPASIGTARARPDWWRRRSTPAARRSPAKAGPTCCSKPTVVPHLEGTGVAFVLPSGVQPADPSLPGVVRDGRWRATVMPAPPAGITLRLRLSAEDVSRLADARIIAIVHGAPGGVGWQRLPPWLPQDAVVWSAESWFVLPWPAPGIPAAGWR